MIKLLDLINEIQISKPFNTAILYNSLNVGDVVEFKSESLYKKGIIKQKHIAKLTPERYIIKVNLNDGGINVLSYPTPKGEKEFDIYDRMPIDLYKDEFKSLKKVFEI